MAKFSDLKNSIAQLSYQFGRDSEILEKILPGEDKQEARIQHRFKSQSKKWRQQTQLKTGSVTYQSLPKELLQAYLRRHVQETGFDFPIGNFKYQGLKMDVMALMGDRVMELSIKTTLDAFAAEFAAVYRLGSRAANKHSALESGKALPAFFYFVCPAGMLTREDVPGHCGLIHATVPSGMVTPSFSIIKAAPMLHKERIPASTYKIIAQHLQRHNEALISRYQRGILSALNPAEKPEFTLF